MIPSLKSLKFKFPWRVYQERFLEHFSEHIKDGHLHVIAPPGSGKTLLGLEILCQIGEKAIVLSPTLTIRDQWEDRLQEYFSTERNYDKFSFDLSNSSDITFSTYQGLHAFYKKHDDAYGFLEHFRKMGIKTIVLDEAHHLKNEWWKCLFALKQDQDLTIVALTATPPFDSTQAEIKRYFDLCGEVDDEIAIPSLVKEGDLCPHQDFVHFSLPDQLTIDYIVAFRLKVAQLLKDLKTDKIFVDFILNHRFYSNTENSLEEIYKHPTFFSAQLIFLNAIGTKIPKGKLKVLGFENKDKIEYPSFNNDWASVLLNHILFNDRDHLSADDEIVVAFEKKLKRLGVLKTHRVDLIGNEAFYKTLSNSPSKLNSIVDITKAANQELGHNLRSVILTDYIRKEYLELADERINEIDKLGVVPIFHKLRNSTKDRSKIAVLTGSLVIISTHVYDVISADHGAQHLIALPLEADDSYVCIKTRNSISASLVEIVTDLFQKGTISIIIGTKSLLGEGWDAPAINTLILASAVGSFVTSNQMRGRAIRTFKPNPNKTAVIWHLACLDPSDENGGSDVATLSKRFTAFMGISNNNPLRIENGIERLGLGSPQTQIEVEERNKISAELAINRTEIARKWKEAITSGTSLSKELKSFYRGGIDYPKQKRLYFKDVVLTIFIELILGLGFFVPEIILKNLNILLQGGWLKFLYILISALVLGYGVKMYNAVRLYINHGRLHKDIYKIGETVLDTLHDLGYINSDLSKVEIKVRLDKTGTVSCIPMGMSNYESTLFVNALEEVIAPVENPRYLLLRKEWLRNIIGVQRYLVVPDIIGDKKENARRFLYHWKRNVGNARIIYTRHLAARKLLLKARLFHMSNAEEKKTKKSVIWN